MLSLRYAFAFSYVKAKQNRIDAVIVYSTSRFSRTGSTTIIEELKACNIPVFSASTDYDPREISGEMMQGMELLNARIDNAVKTKAVKDAGRRALESGRWISKAPRGYEVKTDKPWPPLLGTIRCRHCGKNMTASLSTKMRKKYGRDIGYYTCSRKGCKHNVSAKTLNEKFEEELEAEKAEIEKELEDSEFISQA